MPSTDKIYREFSIIRPLIRLSVWLRTSHHIAWCSSASSLHLVTAIPLACAVMNANSTGSTSTTKKSIINRTRALFVHMCGRFSLSQILTSYAKAEWRRTSKFQRSRIHKLLLILDAWRPQVITGFSRAIKWRERERELGLVSPYPSCNDFLADWLNEKGGKWLTHDSYGHDASEGCSFRCLQ